MKKLFLIFTFFQIANAASAQCDDPELWYSTEDNYIFSYNLATNVRTQRGFSSSFGDFFDLGFAPDGNLYGIINDDFVRLNKNGAGQYATLTVLTRTSGTMPGDGVNALTFLPDGTALIGTNSDGGSIRNRISRITISGNNYSVSTWYDVPNSSINIRSGGDFILLGDKLYAAMWDGSQSYLYEFRVNATTYGRVSTLGIYPFSGRLQGMAAINGVLYGGFSDGTLKRITVTGTTASATTVYTQTGTGGSEIYGLTALDESMQVTNPVISGSGTICTSTKPSTTLTSSSATGGHQWYRDGVIIPGATGRTYTASVAGSYTVQVNFGAGCVKTSAPVTVTTLCNNIVSGMLWNDVNGDVVINTGEVGTNLSTSSTNGIWVSLVSSTGVVVQSVPVGVDGSYEFSTANTGSHTIYVTKTGVTEGVNISSVDGNNFVLPSGYLHQGTNVGGTPNTSNTSGSLPVNITGSISSLNFAIADPATLPVLFSYIAASVEGENLLVRWSTASETNNSHFEIEASADGKTFTTIGSLASKAANGNSSVTLAYNFTAHAGAIGIAAGAGLFLLGGIGLGMRGRRKLLFSALLISGLALGIAGCTKSDAGALAAGGDIFIRIAQVDKDGARSYSKVIRAVRN